MRGIHGEKIIAAIENNKTPSADKERLRIALEEYDKWVVALDTTNAETLDELIERMVSQLNKYKLYIDVDIVFDSSDDFLYRQKGQLKLDNTVIEEFLPKFVRKCIEKRYGRCDIKISSQIPTFSSVYFASSLSVPEIGGGIKIKTKDQDFSMTRTLYIKSSYSPDFKESETARLNLGYVLAELKTNLDKTMFQEASATAHDIKQAVTGAKYFLLCEWLDMTPISTATTDIDEILILRKAKRISSNIRKEYSTFSGRQKNRNSYVKYLEDNPYAIDLFKRFIEHIYSQMENEDLIEENVLDIGYF
ncbi:Bpu10I family restriction endonuclease [uncultured Selenomonas sp.]|uniref:Bpu10I family restriction endonuclease n=1 Tax=uncultured Selenomonas sp. TaxID=159275 RepID=UPI0028EA9317|nr:Bpu10I family restriction endonuclease [uncultured Selenomonas sp.]